MILVVGATGQLGSTIIEKLLGQGKQIRAFVRPMSRYQHLCRSNVELAYGDLRDAGSVEAACRGVETVIATANNTMPAGNRSFEEIEGRGYDNLIKACQKEGVKQFIFVSVPVSTIDKMVPTTRFKRRVEERLLSSGLNYTIFRGSVFMDVWFGLIGSSSVMRGSRNNTMNRPYWLANFLMKTLGGSVEKRGLAFVPGDGKARQAFITVNDVAMIMSNAVDRPEGYKEIFEMGGPQILSWDEVTGVFGKILGREVKPIHTPPAIYRAGFYLFRPFSEAAANLMGLNLLTSTTDTLYDATKLTPFISQPLTTVDEFITQKTHSS